MVFGKILSFVLDRVADFVEAVVPEPWAAARAGPDGWDEIRRIVR